MAWIESHQNLGDHPKTKKLARKLGISIPAAVGHLHLFWWWALDYAQDGNLSKYEPEDLADAVLWEGDSKTFVEAMHDSRFIDGDPGGPYVIHDWWEYAGRLIKIREADAERKRKSRKPKENRQTSAGRPTDGARNTTEPNQTKPDQKIEEEDAQARGEGTKTDPRPPESFFAAHKRVFGFECNPFQAQDLVVFIEQDHIEEGAVINAIERAGLHGKGYNFRFITTILDNYFKSGVRTLEQARAFDAVYDADKANKIRGEPGGGQRTSRQQQKLSQLDQMEKEAEVRDRARSS